MYKVNFTICMKENGSRWAIPMVIISSYLNFILKAWAQISDWNRKVQKVLMILKKKIKCQALLCLNNDLLQKAFFVWNHGKMKFLCNWILINVCVSLSIYCTKFSCSNIHTTLDKIFLHVFFNFCLKIVVLHIHFVLTLHVQNVQGIYM